MDARDSAVGRLLPFVAGGLFFINNFPGAEAFLLLALLFNIAFGRGGVKSPGSLVIPLLVALLLAAGLIGGLISDEIDYRSLGSFLSKFFIFFVLIFTDYSKDQFRCLIYGFIGGAAVSSVLMILNFFGFIDISPPADYIEIRQSAFMGDPNIIGAFLVFALMLAHHCLRPEGLMAPGSAHRRSLVRRGLVGLILFGLLLTFSRAAWINLAIAVVIYVFFMPLFRRDRRRSLLPAILFLLSVVAAVLALRATTDLLDVFFDRFDPDLLSEATYLRRSTQVEVLGEFRDSELSTLLFGHGPLSSEGVTGMNPHLTPYQVLFELGLVSAALIILVGVTAVLRSLRYVSIHPAILVVLPPCLAGFAINSLAVDTFYWRLPWLMTALVVMCACAPGSRPSMSGGRSRSHEVPTLMRS
jgi:hypothetical protein